MNSKLVLAAMLGLAMANDNNSFGGYKRPKLPDEPKLPTEAEIFAQDKIISEAEKKRQRKAEKRLSAINKTKATYNRG